jgi:benzoyl-CoA 2,3-dioxygenase component B
LQRHSGDADKPRILSTFNEPISDWLSFFMFTFFTDRDGKFQLKSFAESGFDPLARTTRFMLTEEGHHMFVGDSGIARVIRRTVEVMKQVGEEPDKVRAGGAIDLPTIQRYLNFWFSSSLDLFGAESSSNAASYFAAGVKGRPDEAKCDDHLCRDGVMSLQQPDGKGGIASEDVPLRNAMNEVVRNAYIHECTVGVRRWNGFIAGAGFKTELTLPSGRFHRSQGAWANQPVDPAGNLMPQEAYRAALSQWVPSAADRVFVHSLMHGVTEPGKIAGWIAPPDRGVNELPLDYLYVRLN